MYCETKYLIGLTTTVYVIERVITLNSFQYEQQIEFRASIKTRSVFIIHKSATENTLGISTVKY